MGGLALGSYVAGRLIDRRRDPLRVYALLEAGIGAYALLTPMLFGLTNEVVRIVYHAAGEGSPLVFGVLRAVIAFLILVVPTTLMDDADLHTWSHGEDIMARLIRALVHACASEPALNSWLNAKEGTLRLGY